MGKLFVALFVILAVAKSCGGKEPSAEQQAFDNLRKENRAIEAANPGIELAALQCGQLADTQEQVGMSRAQSGLDTTGYTRKEAYRFCMESKGFGHVVGK